MTGVSLASVSSSIRSKNAGPFWVTVDIFFDNQQSFYSTSQRLQSEQVAKVLQLDTDVLKRFDLPDIFVIKFSFPRPLVQGSRLDRDMHGAQFACLLADLRLEPE